MRAVDLQCCPVIALLRKERAAEKYAAIFGEAALHQNAAITELERGWSIDYSAIRSRNNKCTIIPEILPVGSDRPFAELMRDFRLYIVAIQRISRHLETSNILGSSGYKIHYAAKSAAAIK